MPIADSKETAPANPGTAPRSPIWSWKFAAVLAIFIALNIRLFALISRYAVNVFFMDQWDFNEATLFQKHSLWEMFSWQHGPHRQGLGAITAYIVEPLFQWNTRWESFLVGGIVILAAVCALWLKYRLFGEFSIFDICIPLILLTPLQYETLFLTANLAHGPLPLLLVLLFCLSWTVRNPPLRYTLILLVNFAALYTGFGFFLGVITPLALAADFWLDLRFHPNGKLFFIVSLVISLASFASFFIHYKLDTSVDCAPNLVQVPVRYATFLFVMLANLFGVKGVGVFAVLTGLLIFAALLGALLLSVLRLRPSQSADRAKSWTSAILLLFCLLFAANAAYGRSCLGPEVAQVSRYIIYMNLGLLGLYFLLLTLPASWLRMGALLALTAVLLVAQPIRRQDENVMRFVSTAKRNWKSCFLQYEDIRGCNHAVGYGVYPNLDRNLKGKLEFLKQTKQNLYSGRY